MFAPPYEQALAAQLTEMLRRTGHLRADETPKDVPDLLAVASLAVREPVPVPRVVIEMDAGTVVAYSTTAPVEILILDADTEGGEEENVFELDAGEHYVTRLGPEDGRDTAAYAQAVFDEVDAIRSERQQAGAKGPSFHPTHG